jgi:uncharacterized protein YcsI (UPF0317 family)
MSMNALSSGSGARQAIRSGEWQGPTAGLAPGYVQANLVILARTHAADFRKFCDRNPKPCPVLDVTTPGSPYPSADWAQGADLRTDLPLYRLYEQGEAVQELTDITGHWQEDSVGFLLGCSFTFEQALMSAGVPVRHVACGCNVPMYLTNRQCQPAGIFRGPLVVSMRPIPSDMVDLATKLTSRYPNAHGAPVHAGDARALGIADLDHPDYGDPVPVLPGEVPVFWACGVTTQAVARASRVPRMITHAPGHMFITDRFHTDLLALG